jgi:hypothetical protein
MKQGTIEYDERGRPFTYIGQTNQRSYLSPAVFDPSWKLPENTFFKEHYWDTDEGEVGTHLNYQNLGTVGVLGIAGAAATPSIISALTGGSGAGAGGGAGAASLSSPSALGTTMGAVPTSSVGSAVAGTSAAASGVLPSASIVPTLASTTIPQSMATLPAATTGLGTSAGTSAAAKGVGSALGKTVKDKLTSDGGKKALRGLAGLGGAALGSRGGGELSPEVQQILAEAIRRIMAQGPLFEQMNRTVMSRMPKPGGGQ